MLSLKSENLKESAW